MNADVVIFFFFWQAKEIKKLAVDPEATAAL